MPADEIHSGLEAGRPAPVQGEPHIALSGDADSYAGVIRLRGALAEVKPSYLFVSVMAAGERRPACSTKIELGDASLGQIIDGERVVPFLLEGCNVVESGVELQVWYDLDGFVDTKEQGSIIERHAIERADQAVDFVLDPASMK